MGPVEYLFVGFIGLIFGLNLSSIIWFIVDSKKKKNNEKNKKDE